MPRPRTEGRFGFLAIAQVGLDTPSSDRPQPGTKLNCRPNPCVDHGRAGVLGWLCVQPKTLIAALALGLPALVLTPRLTAQDVTVTPLEWAELDDAPDHLPAENHPMHVKFPEDLRETPDPGYVIIQIFLDEKGRRLSNRLLGTLPAYENAVSRASQDWKHQPGYRHGQPVNTYSRSAVIFNPASADLKKPDAMPRVLAVHLAVDVSRKTKPDQPARPPEVVWATVKLNAAGQPTAVQDAPADLGGVFENSLQKWRFAPARRNGLAVAAELRVPFIVVSSELNMTGEVMLPRAISRPPPIYPMAMRKSRLRGEVLVDFVVDREGRVTHAKIVRSMNPAFDEPALEAVQRWKFEPGRKGGVPVNTHMQVPIGFQLEGLWEGGETGMSVNHEGKQSDLPPEYRYGVPPKLRARVAPIYPYALFRDGVKGEATVGLVINEQGKVIYAKVKKATHPEFGGATLAMVEAWEFEPALKDGRPTRCVFSFQQKFSRYDPDVAPDREVAMAQLEQQHPDRIVGAGKLDAALKPATTRSPVFPVSLAESTEKGQALVEILIDKEGRVCLPRVVSASEPAFGWSAVQAVSFWRFEPPTMKGHAVVTRIRIPFDFALTSTPPAEEKK